MEKSGKCLINLQLAASGALRLISVSTPESVVFEFVDDFVSSKINYVCQFVPFLK